VISNFHWWQKLSGQIRPDSFARDTTGLWRHSRAFGVCLVTHSQRLRTHLTQLSMRGELWQPRGVLSAVLGMRGPAAEHAAWRRLRAVG